MIKNFKYIYINLVAITPIEKNSQIDEISFIEENLTNNYGTIILKEHIEEQEYIIYICVKNGLINVITINKKNFTIQNITSNNKYFIKKKISHPNIILSTGPMNFKKEYLQKKYASNINISPIITLVKNWNIEIYKQILEIINKTFSEILN